MDGPERPNRARWVLLGPISPLLIRLRGDLIARVIHPGSVSLPALSDALSGVFPGQCGVDRSVVTRVSVTITRENDDLFRLPG
jgi:hypothetical protein